MFVGKTVTITTEWPTVRSSTLANEAQKGLLNSAKQSKGSMGEMSTVGILKIT